MTQSSAANIVGKKNREHDILRKVRGTKDQPTDRGIHALTRDFLTLTREKCHGSSRLDPHETRISRVTRIVAGRVGSGQEDSKITRVGSGRVRPGRVGSIRLEICAGRAGSGRDVSKFSRVGSGRVKTSRNSHGSDRVSRPDLIPPRPDPRDSTRPVKNPGHLARGTRRRVNNRSESVVEYRYFKETQGVFFLRGISSFFTKTRYLLAFSLSTTIS